MANSAARQPRTPKHLLDNDIKNFYWRNFNCICSIQICFYKQVLKIKQLNL